MAKMMGKGDQGDIERQVYLWVGDARRTQQRLHRVRQRELSGSRKEIYQGVHQGPGPRSALRVSLQPWIFAAPQTVGSRRLAKM